MKLPKTVSDLELRLSLNQQRIFELQDLMDELETISEEQTKLAIYSNRIYKAKCHYTLLYLNDYFKIEKEYNNDITVNNDKKTVDINGVYGNSNDMKKKLYEDFQKHIIWLKEDLDFTTICKIHSYLLMKIYQHSHIIESQDIILARELTYKMNILEAYENTMNKISNVLYSEVRKGHISIEVSFKVDNYTLTKQWDALVNCNLKNSDGNVCKTFNTYVPFLLRDEFVKYGLEYDEGLGKELITMMLDKQLKTKFPHLIVSKMDNYEFKIAIMDDNEIVL